MSQASPVAGALRRAHNDVHVLRRGDVAVVDVEAVGESEGVAGLQVRRDVGLVYLGLQLVGHEHHDEVGLFGGRGHVGHAQAGLLGGLDGVRALAQAHAHVAAGVLEVQRVGMTLGSVADDGDLLVLDDVGVAVLFVVDGDGHEFWFLSLVAFSIS